jgi:hypothetical protein
MQDIVPWFFLSLYMVFEGITVTVLSLAPVHCQAQHMCHVARSVHTALMIPAKAETMSESWEPLSSDSCSVVPQTLSFDRLA